ncbi:MAG: hypothetical protein HC796_09280 [Synechococcaceae cyanobacterium RL_1_2]|nr:hypothetical protein [Synechococcaceae cyanobacterium RL_1_2]
MNNLNHAVSALVIAAVVSFLIPVGAIGLILGSVWLLLHFFPYQWAIHELSMEVVTVFKTFGGGSTFKGIITIALTTSLAGVLLTGFNLFYSHYSQPLSSRTSHGWPLIDKN